jgi:hypothetical protein
LNILNYYFITKQIYQLNRQTGLYENALEIEPNSAQTTGRGFSLEHLLTYTNLWYEIYSIVHNDKIYLTNSNKP